MGGVARIEAESYGVVFTTKEEANGHNPWVWVKTTASPFTLTTFIAASWLSFTLESGLRGDFALQSLRSAIDSWP